MNYEFKNKLEEIIGKILEAVSLIDKVQEEAQQYSNASMNLKINIVISLISKIIPLVNSLLSIQLPKGQKEGVEPSSSPEDTKDHSLGHSYTTDSEDLNSPCTIKIVTATKTKSKKLTDVLMGRKVEKSKKKSKSSSPLSSTHTPITNTPTYKPAGFSRRLNDEDLAQHSNSSDRMHRQKKFKTFFKFMRNKTSKISSLDAPKEAFSPRLRCFDDLDCGSIETSQETMFGKTRHQRQANDAESLIDVKDFDINSPSQSLESLKSSSKRNSHRSSISSNYKETSRESIVMNCSKINMIFPEEHCRTSGLRLIDIVPKTSRDQRIQQKSFRPGLTPQEVGVIRSNYPDLLQELDSTKIVDRLYQADIISYDDLKCVKQAGHRLEANDKCLDFIILSPNVNTFKEFRSVLRDTYPHLADKISRTMGYHD